MTPKMIPGLNRLLDVRQREVDRLGADMAAKTVQRDRFRSNLERLNQLCSSVGASGCGAPALALNSANYKQAVMQLADSHRDDLAVREADLRAAAQALAGATRRADVLDQVLARSRTQVQRLAAATEQKRQDDLAAQVWYRGSRQARTA